jgi:hypothetical protein
MTRILACAIAALAIAGSAHAQTTSGANVDVPVKKVVLFASGVGYFEHAGTVHGSGATNLRFKTSQINDILKSIVLQDQDGGRVGVITYPSQDPLAKTLRSFQVDIMAAMASAARLGELFEYTVPNVTLARQKSAMLPIVTDSVDVERLSIYNQSVLASNPLNGVRIHNTTGKHLLQGPVTVLEDGSYAGDACIDHLPPGQARLLSYGIDLDVAVDATRNTTASAIRTARIDHGVLSVQRKLEVSQDYVVQNKGAKDKGIVIEHPIRQGWKLASPPAPFETTPTLDRFRMAVAAGKSATLTVKEEIVTNDGVALSSTDTATLVSYSTTTAIPSSVRDALATTLGAGSTNS